MINIFRCVLSVILLLLYKNVADDFSNDLNTTLFSKLNLCNSINQDNENTYLKKKTFMIRKKVITLIWFKISC